ncbi:MAG: hypothetical protein AAFQ82_17620 [Myxococcota bacterium]
MVHQMELAASLAFAAPALLLIACGIAMAFPSSAYRSAQGAALASFALSVFAWLTVQIAGSAVSPTLGLGGVGLSMTLDPLSTTLAFLITFVGVVVIRFSRNYLAGDPGQG